MLVISMCSYKSFVLLHLAIFAELVMLQMRMSQALMRMWPVPFPRSGSASTQQPPGSPSSAVTGSATSADAAALVAHEGVAEIAASLFNELRPYLDQADDVGMPVCFAGHSLGESAGI